jgi:hypothetical protein
MQLFKARVCNTPFTAGPYLALVFLLIPNLYARLPAHYMIPERLTSYQC